MTSGSSRQSSLRITSVVGARPNFMKLAPLARVLRTRTTVEHIVIHTGQHYAPELSDILFRDLGLSVPDANLEVGSGTHAEQTAAIMTRFEPLLAARRPDIVLVYGDVNSTLAAALVAAKLGVPVAHVEAGLRSHDWSMPEEVNRVVTDRLASLLFTPSRDATANLLAEGLSADRIHFVGNIMIDTLVAALPAARACNATARYGVETGRFLVVTLHRPSNVDVPDRLRELMDVLATLSSDLPVLFPVHPRTAAQLRAANGQYSSRVHLVGAISYVEMLNLVANAAVVVTDSGGLQEESTYLGVPCVTVRPSTERPITCSEGTNRLAVSPSALLEAVRGALGERRNGRRVIERWDGTTAERIVGVLCDGVRYS